MKIHLTKESGASIYGLCLVCSVLVNSDSLTVNYGIKQIQFTKITSEPCASDPEESNEVFDRAIRGWSL